MLSWELAEISLSTKIIKSEKSKAIKKILKTN